MTTRKINVTHGRAAEREMAAMEKAARSQQAPRSIHAQIERESRRENTPAKPPKASRR